MCGTIYGAAVFIVMNFVVLPHAAVVKSPLSLPLLLKGVLGHALFVGLPIALAARRITNQSSFSTQGLNYKADRIDAPRHLAGCGPTRWQAGA